MCKFSEFSEAIYYSPEALTLYKGNSQKIQRKIMEVSILKKKYVLNLENVIKWHLAAILRSRRFFWHPYWHINPWHMSNAIYVNYVIFGIYDIIDIYGIGHMSWINMVIWVSKEPSRPQDCSQMSFDNIFEV